MKQNISIHAHQQRFVEFIDSQVSVVSVRLDKSHLVFIKLKHGQSHLPTVLPVVVPAKCCKCSINKKVFLSDCKRHTARCVDCFGGGGDVPVSFMRGRREGCRSPGSSGRERKDTPSLPRGLGGEGGVPLSCMGCPSPPSLCGQIHLEKQDLPIVLHVRLVNIRKYHPASIKIRREL